MTQQFMKNTTAKKSRQPSKAARQRVRDAFDAEKLAHICTTWDFEPYATRVDLPDSATGRKRFFYFKDNGSDVLGIAHLDSVQTDGTCNVVETAAGLLATSGTLDDRLGAYVILELLPKLDVTCDWLLTTDEEIGQSTAEWFDPTLIDKDYNWMFQFDRGGTDVVMYQYETEELCGLVEDCGARVGTGSFSDICALEHLGVAGFNWGVGYQDYHSARSHAWLEDTFRMVARFVKFFKANAKMYLPYEEYHYQAADEWPWASEDEPIELVIDLQVADCGDMVDLNDDSTFIEVDGGTKIVCADCGTMPNFAVS